MPEGDTIFRSATSLRRWLIDRRITAARSMVPGVAAARLVGRRVDAVDARGKHLLIRLSGGLSLHTHMRMSGSWHVYPTGERWRMPAHQARLVLSAGERTAVCFNAPVVELLSPGDEAIHPSLSRLGPDVLGPEVPDPAEVHRRARIRMAASPTVGELLLDQQVVSGIGNIYRCESLFVCGLHPAIDVAALSDTELDEVITTASRMMQASAHATAGRGGRAGQERSRVYRRQGQPCRRCGARIQRALLGRQPRAVYWCPGCQPARPGPSGSPMGPPFRAS